MNFVEFLGRKNGRTGRPFCCSVDYSFEPVSINEPMIVFWNAPKRIRTGMMQTTDAAMTGALSVAVVF